MKNYDETFKTNQTTEAKIKVVIVYRVLQRWRVPVFEMLALKPDIDLTVIYSQDFANTKLISYKGQTNFLAVSLHAFQIKMKTSNGTALVPISPSIFKKLILIRPDVIITEGASNVINNMICFLYSKLFRVRFIQWSLGEIKGRQRSSHRIVADIFFRFVEKHSAAIIAYSSLGKKYFTNIGVKEKNIFVAVNVVNTELRLKEIKDYCLVHQLPYPSLQPNRFKVIFAGAFEENKNIDSLLIGYADFLKQRKDANSVLTLIGDGSMMNDIKRQCTHLEIDNHVEFVGQVNGALCSHFYDASIFVLPGLGGLAVSDSLIHGIPVICSIGDGCELDLIQNYENGIICNDMSGEVITKQLTFLYDNPTVLLKMRTNAQKFAFSNYNIKNYVDVIEKAIKNVPL
jgi:glycosyltransferase involved in cell wall biosynthesis